MTSTTTVAAHPDGLDFVVPTDLEAAEPAEVRGRGRDDVRLLVARRGAGTVAHLAFGGIVGALEPGDVLVVNTSATLPAAVDALAPDGTGLQLNVSTRLPGGLWMVELRRPAGPASTPTSEGRPGDTLSLQGGGRADLLAHYVGNEGRTGPQRLWLATLRLPAGLDQYLYRYGRPIRYGHVRHAWPIAAYQTVFATEAGSAEMPSAARAFTTELVTRLVSRGVGVLPILLHAGVSSPEEDEAPSPEYYRVPPATAAGVNLAREHGHRVVAAGTTVVRALETVADEAGRVGAGEGWTELVIERSRGVRAVDGLLTGWHEPSASHLSLVEAVAGPELLARAYRAALDERYLWHEFGDLCLILP